MKRIPLPQWAERNYSPPPSLWVLRKWAREGQIWPAPERVGRDWYVREDARRQQAAMPSLVEKLAGTEPNPYADDLSAYVYSLEHARENCREFYDPRGVACGVYLVLDKERTRCMYVGSSVNLCHRLRNGWHAPADQPTFSFEVPELHIRNVEATYWLALDPPVNGISPPGMARREVAEKIRSLWT